ncbi:hypothetical protein GCT19_15395 [Paraburkholderia sp. CNPSo 3155]|uniref:hypothetical protein n=1 Tax=Paraburkholderia atlantica TaxID=2654982 RepID=UPI00128C5B67|nr:hypothetical protein [Paraburkholderia atlantica]MPW07022.1 hypothetical protein [Paraburkholderia atlantica]
MDLNNALAGAAPEDIGDIIDVWLWGFSEPANWPLLSDVRQMQAVLSALPYAAHPSVQQAIEACMDYIRIFESDEEAPL